MVTELLTKEHMQRQLCPRGYSCLQIAILSVLHSPHEVLAYWQIAELLKVAYGLKVSEGAVRGAIERLAKYKMLIKERSILGHLKGNRYTFKLNPCPHIPLLANILESTRQSRTDSHMQLVGNTSPSILNKIDRNNLSISSKADVDHKQLLAALSEGDIKFYWPKLAAAGFGTVQIRQIIERQEQVGNGVENVITGLTHAEWELENDEMRDKSGNPVDSPLNWVYSSLAKHGYYRRPKNYISPAEQAELDQKAVVEQEQQALETRKDAQVKVWLTNLTPSEKENVLELTGGAYCGIPENNRLRNYFWENVWPTIRPDLKEIL